MKDIIVKTFSDFKNPEIRKPLQWLIKKTEEEYYMRTRTYEFYEEYMVFAVFIFLKTKERSKTKETLIGGAVVIKCHSRNDKSMDMKGSVVVEMGSLYCDPSYRSKPRPELKISKILTFKRLEYVFKKGLIPIVVTGNPAVLKTLPKIGASEMKEIGNYSTIYPEIRICDCLEKYEGKTCSTCPRKEKATWFFVNLSKTLRILEGIMGKDLMRRIA